MTAPTSTTRSSPGGAGGGRGGTGAVPPPRRNWLEALTDRLGLGSSRRREASCPTCGETNDLVVARWCGRCGARLTELVIDTASSPPRGPGGRFDGTALRRAAAPVFIVALGAAMLVPAALQGEAVAPRGQSVRGDATRTGVVATEAPPAPREIAWTVEGIDPALGQAQVGPARGAAIMVQPGLVEVLDLTTGAPRRQIDLATTQEAWPLGRIVDDVALLPDQRLAQLAAQEVDTGRPLWEVDLPGFVRPVALDALTVGDDLVLPSGIGNLLRLDRATGEQVWAADLAIRDGRAVVGIVGSGDERASLLTVEPPGAQIQVGGASLPSMSGLDLDSSRVTWKVELDAVDALGPLASNDRLAVHGDSTRGPQTVVVVRNATNGAELTSIPVTFELRDVAVIGDLVLVLDATGLHGWADRGVREVFTFDLADRFVAPLLVNTEPPRVVVPQPDGLVVLGPDGTISGRIPTDGFEPAPGRVALANGVITVAEPGLRASGWDLAGNQLWNRLLQAPATGGLATDGELVVANGPGGLVTLDGRKGERLVGVERIDEDGLRVPVPGSVALEDGMAVVSPFGGGPSGRGLSALQARSGIGAWDRSGESPPAFGTLTRTPGFVWLSVDDEIHAYETQTGRRTFASFSGIRRGPLAVTPEVVVATPATPICAGNTACADGIRAVEIETRDEAWVSPAPACGPPAIRDGRVLVPTTSGPWAVGVTDGQWLWSAQPGGQPGCAPLAVGETAIVQGDGTHLSAWESATGNFLWTVDLGEALVTDPVLAGGEVVVADADGQLTAFDVLTGDLLWQFRLPGPPLADPVVVEGRWVLLLRDGRVIGLR